MNTTQGLHPISSSGPTASNAARPYAPTTIGSAAFNVNVTTPENASNTRAERNLPGATP